jgi:hypothetical protein
VNGARHGAETACAAKTTKRPTVYADRIILLDDADEIILLNKSTVACRAREEP